MGTGQVGGGWVVTGIHKNTANSASSETSSREKTACLVPLIENIKCVHKTAEVRSFMDTLEISFHMCP